MNVEEYFHGKGCVVTGAASGIGFALAEVLLKAGAVVFMADRDTKTLESALEQLSAHKGRVHPMTVDVSREEQVQRMVEEAASRHGRLDILFNNAGIGGTKAIEKVTMEEWRRIIDVNLWSVIYGIHFALPIMRSQGGGHIVSTSSIAGILPIPFQSLYCATKYAVTGLSESLRFELEDEGICFSVVCPGEVATRIWGTPIIGERVEAKIPENAISAGEAAKLILAGVANKEGIIPLPDSARTLWELYRTSPEAAENILRDIARERRSLRA
ncbi:MAG: SDR family oxidoreductase [Candidatus Eremiobacteraeota bacterium]|nr:SDR family oxidoreductase [Candidatus Eremiobacteraeota bacterium]